MGLIICICRLCFTQARFSIILITHVLLVCFIQSPRVGGIAGGYVTARFGGGGGGGDIRSLYPQSGLVFISGVYTTDIYMQSSAFVKS